MVIFEGWCVGAKHQTNKALKKPINNLESKEDSRLIWRKKVNFELGSQYRRIFKTKNTGKSTLKELLLGLFVSELFKPSPKIRIVSPWISDIIAIDNIESKKEKHRFSTILQTEFKLNENQIAALYSYVKTLKTDIRT